MSNLDVNPDVKPDLKNLSDVNSEDTTFKLQQFAQQLDNRICLAMTHATINALRALSPEAKQCVDHHLRLEIEQLAHESSLNKDNICEVASLILSETYLTKDTK